MADAANIRLVLVVVLAASVAHAKSVKVADAETSRNCSAIESVNNVVNELINQTSFIINASSTTNISTTSTTAKVIVNDQVGKQRKGLLMGLWDRESTTTTTKEPDADSQEDDEDEEDEVSEEESDTSSETELMSDPRNDSSADRATTQDVQNFHFAIKISHDDAYNAETLALRTHLNRTIEKLREFNDKYEILIEENKTIRKDLQELKHNSSRPASSTQTSSQQSTSDEATTASSKLEITTAKSQAEKQINGVRVNLLV